MELLTKDELINRIAERAKELNSKSTLLENKNHYTRSAGKDERQAIREVLNDYIRNLFGIDKNKEKLEIIGQLEKYGTGGSSGNYLVVISICYIFKDDYTILPWNEDKIFKSDKLKKIANLESNGEASDFHSCDYVRCSLLPQTNIFELLVKKKLFTFDWDDKFQKIPHPERKESEFICNAVRILKIKNPDDSKQKDFYIPMGPNLLKMYNEEFCEKMPFLTELIDNITTKRNELNQLEQKLPNKEIELKMITEALSEKQDAKARIDKEIEDLNQNKANLCTQIEKQQEKIKTANDIIARANAYGYLLGRDNNDSSPKTEVFSSDFDEAVRQIRCALKHNTGWNYSDFIVRSMLLGILSKQLIILCGEPGSGKTSFAEEFSKVVGYNECVVIPVQSSWMDSSDLLGYYNPIKDTYVPTFFLESLNRLNKLASAEGNADKLFFICLDEMNLAHIEYYFADFLSALQFDAPEKRIIRLYDNNIKNNDDSDSNKNNLDIPPRISIANNIRFIGTINIDETTKTLSPKVIDRTFFVRMENDSDGYDDLDLQNEQSYTNYYFSLNKTEDNSNCGFDANGFKEEANKILRSKLSHRFDKALRNIESYVPKSSRDIREILCASLVLPRINDVYENEQDLINFVPTEKLARFVNEKMRFEDDELVSYWRK